MTDHHENDANNFDVIIDVQAVLIDVQNLLTEATRALLNGDWRRASNAIKAADKHLQWAVVPWITRRTQRAA